MYWVVDLMLVELSGHTDYEAQLFPVILLTEHCSHSSVRGVGVQDIGLVSVREGEDNVTKKTLFQLLEGLLRGSPVFFSSRSAR